MKTPDEIKKGLARCASDKCFGEDELCPYRSEGADYCMTTLAKDALAYIRELETQMPKWISVDERLPEICERVLVVDDFGVVTMGRCETFGFDKCITIDGCSRFGCIPTVKYWMPLPEPPKENEGGNDGKSA